MDIKHIRNFSIIAHIDHGKSTLADRIMEACGEFDSRSESQILDSMDIERERGITIKLNTATMKYKYNGEEYLLNLIDTPGHVDFSYEVSRSLAASDGAILLVDGTQGIEAQTLANLFLALDNNLEIIPVINKIDLPSSDVEKVTEELLDLGLFEKNDILKVSAKTGQGVKELIDRIVEKVSCPKGDDEAPLEALIFDSKFDSYRGVVISARIFNGTLKVGDTIKMHESDKEYIVTELLITTPNEENVKSLSAGEVGHIVASIKDIESVHVGDTITSKEHYTDKVLPGYKKMKPMVYSGVYPIDSNKFESLRDFLSKLKLNDAALEYSPETSKALGYGFRCGFLGLLHMDIVKERISREAGIDIITTAPSVIYKVILTSGETLEISSPSDMPDASKIKEMEEPFILTNIFVPSDFIGPIMELCQNRRGEFKNIEYISKTRVNIHYVLPLSEIVYDFFDKLKSITKGYASFDYEVIGYRPSKLVKLDIMLNGEIIDALSVIVHKDEAYERGKRVCENLKENIPRQLFEIPIQASIGSKIIARETVKALRKDVLAKCYGGDITRKKKLLEKQKAGKKKMKQIGSVYLPEEAFMSVLEVDKNE